MKIAQIYTHEHPVLLDKAIEPIQMELAKIPWLNNVFGRALRLARKGRSGNVYYPAVYIGSREHHSVAPSESNGAFVFFDFPEGQTFPDYTQHIVGKIEAKMRIIVWYKERERTGSADHREQRKLDVLQAIRRTTFKSSRIKIDRCYEKAEEIYKGYSLNETDNNFLMYPYGGFCFEGFIQYEEPCLQRTNCDCSRTF